MYFPQKNALRPPGRLTCRSAGSLSLEQWVNSEGQKDLALLPFSDRPSACSSVIRWNKLLVFGYISAACHSFLHIFVAVPTFIPLAETSADPSFTQLVDDLFRSISYAFCHLFCLLCVLIQTLVLDQFYSGQANNGLLKTSSVMELQLNKMSDVDWLLALGQAV